MKKLLLVLLTLGFSTLFNAHTFAADEAAHSSTATDPIADTANYLKSRWPKLLEHVPTDALKVFIGENLVQILESLPTRSMAGQLADDDRIAKTCLRHALLHFGNPHFRQQIEENPCVLINLIELCDEFIVQLFIDAGVDVKKKGEHGVTALHSAALRGASEILNLLLAAGADANAKTERQHATPLHFLASTYITQDLNAQTEAHITLGLETNPAIIELAKQKKEILRPTVIDRAATLTLLLRHGADIHALDARGRKPVDILRPEPIFDDADPEANVLAAQIQEMSISSTSERTALYAAFEAATAVVTTK